MMIMKLPHPVPVRDHIPLIDRPGISHSRSEIAGDLIDVLEENLGKRRLEGPLYPMAIDEMRTRFRNLKDSPFFVRSEPSIPGPFLRFYEVSVFEIELAFVGKEVFSDPLIENPCDFLRF